VSFDHPVSVVPPQLVHHVSQRHLPLLRPVRIRDSRETTAVDDKLGRYDAGMGGCQGVGAGPECANEVGQNLKNDMTG